MHKCLVALILVSWGTLAPQESFASSEQNIDLLRQEIHQMRTNYENRIADLEDKLRVLEEQQTSKAENSAAESRSGGAAQSNSFNPSIGLVLNGKYSSYSANESSIGGFALGEEAERSTEGLSLNETEVILAANIDDKFYGSSTVALANHDDHTEAELEEAYVRTLPGVGLPPGITLKMGRAFWTLGYLNEHHSHADDFSDRPLPYRAFLNNVFNDDGAEISYLLPTDIYAEIGGGLFQGSDFPFGGSDGNGIGAWSTYFRLGDDIGENQSWRLGTYWLSGEASTGRSSNEDVLEFIGDTDLFVTDLRYTWAPTGNPTQRELTFQGEFLRRWEEGTYDDLDLGTGAVDYDHTSSGWYAQLVYKFHRQWRLGARYSRLGTPGVPLGLIGSILDGGGYDARSQALMLDWSNSEFSRIRLQFGQEKLMQGARDNQVTLQYIMSMGAHGAHRY